jgi:hypothetical protein
MPEITANIISFITASFEDYRYIRMSLQDNMMKEYYDLMCPDKLKAPPIWEPHTSSGYIVSKYDESTVYMGTQDVIETYNNESHLYKKLFCIRTARDVFQYFTVMPASIKHITINDVTDNIDTIVCHAAMLVSGMAIRSMSLNSNRSTLWMTTGERTCTIHTVVNLIPSMKLLSSMQTLTLASNYQVDQLPDLSSCVSLTTLYICGGIDKLKGLDYSNIQTLRYKHTGSDILSKFVNIRIIDIRCDDVDELDLSLLPMGSLKELYVANAHITKLFPKAPLLEFLKLDSCTFDGSLCALPRLQTLVTNIPMFNIPPAPLLNYMSVSDDIIIPTRASLRILHMSTYIDEYVAQQPGLAVLEDIGLIEITNIKTYPSLKYIDISYLHEAATSSVQPSIRKLTICDSDAPTHVFASQVFGDVSHEYFNDFGYVRALD